MPSVNLSSLGGAGWQFFDANGTPLSGGKLYTYAAGTTTPLASYTTDAGSTPNPNPIILDAAGRIPNQVWLVQAALYKFVLTTSIDVSIWTKDNIPGIFASAVLNATLIEYDPPFTGALTSSYTVANKLAQYVSVKDFGAVGDGVTNDTAAIQAAINASQTTKNAIYIPAGTYVVTSELLVNYTGLSIFGDGPEATILAARGNFGQILRLGSSAAEILISGVAFWQTGTTTKCVFIDRGLTCSFQYCGFRGDAAVSLVLAQGDITRVTSCKFDCNGASTLGIEFDGHNQNCEIGSNTRFGGVGLGLFVNQSSGALPRVEGLKITSCFFINTGIYNVRIGNSLLTTLAGCALDQAGSFGLILENGAESVIVDGNWIGMQPISSGFCIRIEANGGGNHIISNNQLFGGYGCIQVLASASARVTRLTIDSNMFLRASDVSLDLDSVFACTITSNQDSGIPIGGSWWTRATNAAGGNYVFDNNRWHTVSPVIFDVSSTYRGGNDTGIVWRNKASFTAAAGTSATVNHGCFRTPTTVFFSIEGSNLGAQWLTSVGATQFTANWAISSTPIIRWQAEV